MSGYTISEEYIDGVMRYMQAFHPEHADRDYCRTMLETFQAGLISGLRHMALNNPDAIDELYEKYEEYLKSLR